MSPRVQIKAAQVVTFAAAVLLAGCSEDKTQASPAPSGGSSSAAESALALPVPNADGRSDLERGRYLVPVVDSALAYEVDVPDGWRVLNGNILNDRRGRDAGAFLVAAAPEGIGVAEHPCTDHSAVAVGPGVKDLVSAVSTRPVLQVSRPVPAQLGAVQGQYVDVRIPTGYDSTPCEDGEGTVALWGTGPGDMWSSESGYHGQWWVLNVDGQRLVVMPACSQPCQGSARTLRAMAESMEFVHGD
jgi:hypothetical protein